MSTLRFSFSFSRRHALTVDFAMFDLKMKVSMCSECILNILMQIMTQYVVTALVKYRYNR